MNETTPNDQDEITTEIVMPLLIQAWHSPLMRDARKAGLSPEQFVIALSRLTAQATAFITLKYVTEYHDEPAAHKLVSTVLDEFTAEFQRVLNHLASASARASKKEPSDATTH